jgi:hypothetical protein
MNFSVSTLSFSNEVRDNSNQNGSIPEDKTYSNTPPPHTTSLKMFAVELNYYQGRDGKMFEFCDVMFKGGG